MQSVCNTVSVAIESVEEIAEFNTERHTLSTRWIVSSKFNRRKKVASKKGQTE